MAHVVNEPQEEVEEENANEMGRVNDPSGGGGGGVGGDGGAHSA